MHRQTREAVAEVYTFMKKEAATGGVIHQLKIQNKSFREYRSMSEKESCCKNTE
jgi:hypothetical protein